MVGGGVDAGLSERARALSTDDADRAAKLADTRSRLSRRLDREALALIEGEDGLHRTSGGWTMPQSVTKPETKPAGVTSKAGL